MMLNEIDQLLEDALVSHCVAHGAEPASKAAATGAAKKVRARVGFSCGFHSTGMHAWHALLAHVRA